MHSNTPIKVYVGEAVAQAGYVNVPHLLLRHATRFNITPEELVFLLCLMAQVYDYRYAPRNLRDIAARMGKSIDQVRRYSKRLEGRGLITVEPVYDDYGQTANKYSLWPLWQQLAKGFTAESPPPGMDARASPSTDERPPPAPMQGVKGRKNIKTNEDYRESMERVGPGWIGADFARQHEEG